jgi:hypothetical protein
MSVISKLIVVHSDPRTTEAVRYGFEREGADVIAAPSGDLPALADTQLIVAGSDNAEEGAALLDGLREDLQSAQALVPILYLGNGLSRSQAFEAGASEVLPQPAFIRDVVTAGTLLASPKKGPGEGASGELSDHYGVFYLVRTLSALGRRGVLTMIRGLRRGELRFYDGEVTSAQVGILHGMGALHQLLLWTEARFEFRREAVVRRQQIPLAPADTLADAARFLSEIKSVAEGLSPSPLSM